MKKQTTIFFCGCVIAVLLAVMTGCAPRGYIYHHITRPLDTNMSLTPAMLDTAREGDTKHFSYDIVDIYWGSNGIGDIAKKYGLQEIYFVDIETFRILGIWEREFVHVYGK